MKPYKSDSFASRVMRRADGDAYQMSLVDSKNAFSHTKVKPGLVGKLGKVTWEVPRLDSQLKHDACLIEDGNGETGFLRIPDFQSSSAELERLRATLAVFEKRTRMLVLDITQNAGGSMFFMYAVASLLTSRTLDVPKHTVALTEEHANNARDVLAHPDEHSAERVRYANEVLTEWSAGRWGSGRRSFPLYLGGITQIEPSEFGFSGTVLIVIDERTCSAGEFFASILRDNNVHALFGAKTAGAGGCVRKLSWPESSALRQLFEEDKESFAGCGFSYITWTIARRTNGELIENHGVAPDYEYDIARRYYALARGHLAERDDSVLSIVYDEYDSHLLAAIRHQRAYPGTLALQRRAWQLSDDELQYALKRHLFWRQEVLTHKPRRVTDIPGRVQLGGAVLAGADLRNAELFGADLHMANLVGANLEGANLDLCNLHSANLRGANLRRAQLTYACLVEAELQDADFSGATLRQADLTGARMTGAVLSGCDLFDTCMHDLR